jgi:hypothetical protein
MQFKVLKCPVCNEIAKGTIETLKGCAQFDPPDDEGKVNYSGYTEVFWDEQKTVTNLIAYAQLVCPAGHDWFSPVEWELSLEEKRR